eukprot:TRINITY_DN8930_c0_g1_i1.p1 TRINITY_DN8930_c0_g1~~TRINITY_DN8930_c0_g1_i1.p1  ORF type:complete len:210 (-),score=22.23 TRINITY_DN8930_c0_g1_i1:22-606(-)
MGCCFGRERNEERDPLIVPHSHDRAAASAETINRGGGGYQNLQGDSSYSDRTDLRYLNSSGNANAISPSVASSYDSYRSYQEIIERATKSLIDVNLGHDGMGVSGRQDEAVARRLAQHAVPPSTMRVLADIPTPSRNNTHSTVSAPSLPYSQTSDHTTKLVAAILRMHVQDKGMLVAHLPSFDSHPQSPSAHVL